VFEARARISIVEDHTAQARRGHFAMGVGLEAGLTSRCYGAMSWPNSSTVPTLQR